ncbi:14716_t:CDS:2, partial [Dentiscutata erythropus]
MPHTHISRTVRHSRYNGNESLYEALIGVHNQNRRLWCEIRSLKRRIVVLEAELEEIRFWDAESVEENWKRDKKHWRVVQERNQLWVQ